MCGICGFTQSNGSEADYKALQAMCDVMAHRGPDGEGRYIASGIALGHRRLALIDIEGGAQPMVRSEGGVDRWAIVFNGEIYNYRDLRADLEDLGYAFETNSDTEVLLVGFIAWGEQVLQRVRGMFAFAVFDARSGELFCARDFFGIKPFYYTVQGTQFIFASEVKCILEHPAYERELNEEALAQYLCFQFSVLPETFFKGIYKLLPGHCMRVHADGSTEDTRYWRPEYHEESQRTLQDTVELIGNTMRESVRYHNVADVEVGSFLSSGIDSSYLAALLTRENPHIKTFTVGFSEYEGARDEVSWARELAGLLKVENDAHHITEREYWDAVPLVQWHMDEPSGDPSAVALYFVDQLAARRVKAVLSGEGADEFFGGYRIYQAPLASEHLKGVPSSLLRAGSKVLRAVGKRGANYLERASEGVEDWYYTNAHGVAFTPEQRNDVLATDVLSRLGSVASPQQLAAPVYAEAAGLDEVTRMQYADLQLWLVGDILLKTDKMAMAHSLESRVPFLDREVFALAASITTSQKVTESQTKVALRQAAERAIPSAWAQKEKLGFPVPVVSWLREDAYYEIVKHAFESPEANRFFKQEQLVNLLEEHRAGKVDNTRRIWIVYSFLTWYRVYFIGREKPCVQERDSR